MSFRIVIEKQHIETWHLIRYMSPKRERKNKTRYCVNCLGAYTYGAYTCAVCRGSFHRDCIAERVRAFTYVCPGCAGID